MDTSTGAGPEEHPPQDPSAAGVSLDAGVTRITELTLRQRALDRDRLVTYAQLVETAMNTGSSPELAYRAVRAEIAAGLHVSEYAVDRELDLAYALQARYPAVRDALGQGTISVAHARVISDAGQIIGSSEEMLARHARYEVAVLPVAVQVTPGRLRPIAKRLAEEFAELSIDERHRVAVQRRRVEVIDSDDGMAEIHAFVSAEIAYAVKDRLGRISKHLWRTEAREACEAATAATAAATSDGVVPRSLDQVRADTFAELLLHGNPYIDDTLTTNPAQAARTAGVVSLGGWCRRSLLTCRCWYRSKRSPRQPRQIQRGRKHGRCVSWSGMGRSPPKSRLNSSHRQVTSPVLISTGQGM